MNRAHAADGVTLAWSAAGNPDHPAVIMTHSLGCDSTMWQAQVEGLADSFRVITLDMRGHGQSEAPPGPYSLDMLGADVVAVADAAGVAEFSICGNSIGGIIALWVAINHPRRIRSLIASSTAAKVGTAQRWAERSRAVTEEGMARIAPRVVAAWFAPEFASRHPHRWERALATFVATDPQGYIGCCEALADGDLRSQVGSISAPTLILAGEVDPATPPAQAEWLHSQIPSSRLKIFPAAAHLPNLEDPVAYTEEIKAFLNLSST